MPYQRFATLKDNRTTVFDRHERVGYLFVSQEEAEKAVVLMNQLNEPTVLKCTAPDCEWEGHRPDLNRADLCPLCGNDEFTIKT